jgi:L-alanine-DL-glutamate epimerase-like enolase superfamily enzyme
MSLATGEYIYDYSSVSDHLDADAEDFIQLDVTRCKGITGFLKSAGTCEVYHMPISSHCAPSLHVALGSSLPNFQHIEYFHDHARIESLLFEGALKPKNGRLAPDFLRPGHGLALKRGEAERYRL